MKVLTIEPDPQTSEAINLMLESSGMNCRTCDNHSEARKILSQEYFDIILMEIFSKTRPDGIDTITWARTNNITTPIFVVSGLTTVDFVVNALMSGADDYLRKPFHKDELVARIWAILQRANGNEVRKINIRGLELDLEKKEFSLNGRNFKVTKSEYILLNELFIRYGEVVSTDYMTRVLKEKKMRTDTNGLKVMISRIKTKIKSGGGDPSLIQCVRKVGYIIPNE